jgi:prolipoprotein diacylglyceryltransferase
MVLGGLLLAAAAGLYFSARSAPRWKLDPNAVQGAAAWVGVAGLIGGALAFWFEKNGLPIYGFGVMLFVAFVVSSLIGGRRAVAEGVPTETIQDLAIVLIIGGLIGARLTSVLTSQPPADFLAFLYEFVQIWNGGIVLYGSVIGGLIAYVVAYFLVFRKKFKQQGISTLKVADVIAPALAVGLALGRIGCFLNGCCYGQAACTDCPVYAWQFPLSAPSRFGLVGDGYQTTAGFTLKPGPAAVVDRVEPGSEAARAGLKAEDEILAADGKPLSGDKARYPEMTAAGNLDAYLGAPENWDKSRDRPVGWPRGKNDLTLTVRTGDEAPRTLMLWPRTLALHPTQLYETVSMGLLFLLLTAYYPFRRHDGQVMALLMIGYGVHRYINELLRADTRPDLIEWGGSLVLVVAGAALWVWLWRQPAQYRFQAPQRKAAAAGAAPDAIPAAASAAVNSAAAPTTATSAARPGRSRNDR